ncbi:hypothetical protein [Cohnella herbarum]|uniref:Uncharacterized protein n=1 Tax=Cohnella herbarum TaxID=2728023 RepID=A0A7Z2VHP1_9BACL|nr:hypothetical protein [Cohnella herbarum]QJD83202.1 hypothetical protein HH215_08460 [Cohnella herbarum]
MKSTLLLLLNLVSLLSIFLFIEHAMTVSPGQVSGNGNPALLFVIPIVVLFLVLVYQWCRWIKLKLIPLKWTIIASMAVIFHWVVGISYQQTSFQRYKQHIAQANKSISGEIDWAYIDSITSGLSIHINNQIFNLNTYLMMVTLSLMLAILLVVLKRKIEEALQVHDRSE